MALSYKGFNSTFNKPYSIFTCLNFFWNANYHLIGPHILCERVLKYSREQFYTNPIRKVNEGTTIYPRTMLYLLLGQLLHLSSAALAIPPEGLEAYTLLSHDGHDAKIIYAFGGYTHPIY